MLHLKMLLERDEEKWDRFSARIPLKPKGIDHVYDFGSNRSEIIVI